MKTARVLLVDDDHDLSAALAQSLEIEGLVVETYDRAALALGKIARDDYVVVLTDYLMPGTDGLELMTAVHAIDPVLPVIVMTGHGDVPTAVKCMQQGAHDFIEKPCSIPQLVRSLNNAIERRRLVLENRALRAELGADQGLKGRLVGEHPSMQALRDRIQISAQAGVDALIVGETGTGKEVVARALHDFSDRAGRP
ncbi:MAG: sigma-54-dependent transcriptional regulator, partial [Litorivicinus sp.]